MPERQKRDEPQPEADASETRITGRPGIGADAASLAEFFKDAIRYGAAPPSGNFLGTPAELSVYEAIVHVAKRLAAPHDPHVERDTSTPRGRIDQFFWNAGDVGDAQLGPLTQQQRAMRQRHLRYGPALSAMLINMRRIVRDFLENQPPAEPKPIDPAVGAMWDTAISRARSTDPKDHIARVRELAGRLRWLRENAPDDEALANTRRMITAEMDGLARRNGVDPAELTALHKEVAAIDPPDGASEAE